MRQAIIIATTPNRYQWLNNILQTISNYSDYPIIIFSDYSFETGKIQQAMKLGYDEFVLLQDSIEVKNTSIFDLMFQKHQGHTVTIDPTMRSFLVKYRSSVLNQYRFTNVTTKLQAVDEEDRLFRFHSNNDPSVICLTQEFNKSGVFEDKFGRNNMVVENTWFKKYKSIWSRSQL